ELTALAQTIGVSLGTFPLPCWLLLQSWGRPRVTRLAFVGCASLARAALVALQIHADILRRLREGVCINDTWRTLEMHASLRPYAGFRKYEAFAEMLERAAAGRSPSPSSPSWFATWPAVAAAAAREGPASPAGARPRPQRAVHAALRALAPAPSSLVTLLVLRLSKLLSRHAAALPGLPWERIAASLASCPCSGARATIRAWADGWLASHRILHPLGKRACAFGCQALVCSGSPFSSTSYSAPLFALVALFLDGFCDPAADSDGFRAVDPGAYWA
ncbi:unnamed protein product, partial [Prorocentrum cordatum]